MVIIHTYTGTHTRTPHHTTPSTHTHAYILLTFFTFATKANVQRALVLVAKVLQSLACGVSPNETYLQRVYERAQAKLGSSIEKLFLSFMETVGAFFFKAVVICLFSMCKT